MPNVREIGHGTPVEEKKQHACQPCCRRHGTAVCGLTWNAKKESALYGSTSIRYRRHPGSSVLSVCQESNPPGGYQNLPPKPHTYPYTLVHTYPLTHTHTHTHTHTVRHSPRPSAYQYGPASPETACSRSHLQSAEAVGRRRRQESRVLFAEVLNCFLEARAARPS